jgi:hypothetical protein
MLLGCAMVWGDHLRIDGRRSRGCRNIVESGNNHAGCGIDGGDDICLEPLSINRLPLVETAFSVLRVQIRQEPLKMSMDLGL